jgi:hypothetical protein
MTATHSHIERTLADAYRKEIDQEENIWRSLPFFAATIAFQLAALFNTVERLPARTTWPGVVALALLAIAAAATVVALAFLAASIFPSTFRYIAPEPDLLAYATGLDEDAAAAIAAGTGGAADPETILKLTLAHQYALATDHNRRINQRRARWRSIAGLATLASVLITIALVVLVVLSYIPMPKEPVNQMAEPVGQTQTIVAKPRTMTVRLPPDMQVVTKGWWTLKQESASIQELEQQDRDAKASANGR